MRLDHQAQPWYAAGLRRWVCLCCGTRVVFFTDGQEPFCEHKPPWWRRVLGSVRR